MKRFFRALGRWLLRFLAALAVVAAVFVVLGWRSFGHRAEGERAARMAASPEHRGDAFVDPQPIVNDGKRMLSGMFASHPDVAPDPPLVVPPIDPLRFASAPASGLRVTWMGHSSTLVEIDGARVLTDPVWSERASPYGFVGPRRWYPAPIALAALPPIDAVVVSHDHYDHLDMGTLVALVTAQPTARFVVPLGIGAHLVYWGIPADRIVELDWWQTVKVGALEIACLPARHASGRFLFDRDAKLWAGYALVGAEHRVYYSGDSGFFPDLREIGNRFGPFDLTMIEAGQYDGSWPDWHMGPERAVQAHTLVRGKVMLPVHWGLFELAHHAWTEPVERVLAAAKTTGAQVITPRPGESVEPATAIATGVATTRWWPDIPWKTAAQDPLVSTGIPPELEPHAH